MRVTITVKMHTDNQQEAAECISHFSQLKAEHVFGPPAEIALRYMLAGGKESKYETRVVTPEEIGVKAPLDSLEDGNGLDIHADLDELTT